MTTKWCLKCDKKLSTKNFNKRAKSRDGLSTWCRSCTSIASKKYRESNAKTMAILKKSWKKLNSEKEKQNNKAYHLTKYWPELTPAEALEAYNTILTSQSNCCKICKRHESEFEARFHVDHCHESLKVRGLLCFNCNVMLGNSLENIETLMNAIEYLAVDS